MKKQMVNQNKLTENFTEEIPDWMVKEFTQFCKDLFAIMKTNFKQISDEDLLGIAILWDRHVKKHMLYIAAIKTHGQAPKYEPEEIYADALRRLIKTVKQNNE